MGREGQPAAPASVPRHVGVIMDGNGRWAEARGLPRSAGHKAGIDALRRMVRASADLGIEYLSVYSFSTENWRRPRAEVSFLLDLLRRFIRQDVAELHAAGTRIKIIGAREDLEPSLVKMLDEAEKLTAENNKLTLVVAFNYGSKQELARAAKKLATEVAAGKLTPDQIDDAALERALDTDGIPPVDLLIRTGGEQRISNFMLWQCAYAEFVFLPVFWPDFDGAALQTAVDEFGARERRFGGLKAQTA
ncbi:isoprenyl transferase [Aestuariivirga litoralis]|uniref:isoprenyl transferase n=1 Tax=Aestuariivirga litoralis TaxID=2650924 RepID=UPI0018C56B1D|nr:isoprenyl transferase [Aestuariivirga litoralis]MBG1231730.1 isoprenyl transferase [Aestuariivirga litoralis]